MTKKSTTATKATKPTKSVVTKKTAVATPMKQLGAKLKTMRFAAPLAAVVIILVLAAVIAVVRVNAVGNDAQGGKPADLQAVQDKLRSQVDNANGAPRSGRDPATQQQNSLSAAASRPTGVSASEIADRPAAATTGTTDHSHHATYDDVYDDPKSTGIGSNGCFTDYGKPGEQCLPVHAAGADKVPNCTEVRKYFKDGIVVSGTDRFHLDRNGDKLACGPGE